MSTSLPETPADVTPQLAPGFNLRIKARGAPPRTRRSVHDALHMQSGLTYCWCVRSCCWTGNRCICSECPCRREDRR